MCTVASLSRPLLKSASSFIGVRLVSTPPPRLYTYFPFLWSILHRRHDPHHRPALPKLNGLCNSYQAITRPDLTQAKHHTYHRRSSISDHRRPQLLLASVNAPRVSRMHHAGRHFIPAPLQSAYEHLPFVSQTPPLLPSESVTWRICLSFPRHRLYLPSESVRRCRGHS